MTLGLGRVGAIIAISGGGVLMAAQLGTYTDFAILAVASALGLVAILLVPRQRGHRPGDRDTADDTPREAADSRATTPQP